MTETIARRTLLSPARLQGVWAVFQKGARRRSSRYRFLCPNCLHFGGFRYACGACWTEIKPSLVHTNGAHLNNCSYCLEPLLPREGLEWRGVRAYCKRCKSTCDRAIYHQRQVRVVATLLPADLASLYQATSAEGGQTQSGLGHVYDDGVWLTYVLNLGSLTDAARSLPRTHALWAVESIWMNASGEQKLALEMARAADRFIKIAGLTEAQQRALTVCVRQSALEPVVEHVLMTRFGMVKYGVQAADFLSSGAQTKVAALGEIGHNIAVPTLLIAWWWAEAEEKAVQIGQPAVPALIAKLKNKDSNAADKLGEIGDKQAVPALITALKGSPDPWMRGHVAIALGEIGDKQAVPPLEAADSLYHRDRDCGYCEALRQLGVK